MLSDSCWNNNPHLEVVGAGGPGFSRPTGCHCGVGEGRQSFEVVQ